MSESIVEPGDKLHIITRRLFPEDLRRHFVGEVVSASGGLFELAGYSFVLSPGVGEYRRRPELRSRILSLADAGFIVNKIPPEVDQKALEYKTIDNRLVVTDSRGFALEINEFGLSR